MKRMFLLLSIVALLLTTNMQTPANNEAEFRLLQGTWEVSVHWVNPEVIGQFQMTITMNSRKDGTVYANGHVGQFHREKLDVAWDFDDVAFYEGTLSSRTSMSGTMTSVTENYGTWSAVMLSSARSSHTNSSLILGTK